MRYVIEDLTGDPTAADMIDLMLAESFPDFLMWESPGNWRWHRLYELFPDHQLRVLTEDGELVGAANSIPFTWDGTGPVPPGFDDAVVGAVDDHVPANVVSTCALAITAVPEHRGAGIPRLLLNELRDRAAALGRRAVVAPLRPTRKAEYPLIPMTDYAAWQGADGGPFDPWLRTHRALGAAVLGVAERSLVISQPAHRWAQLVAGPIPAPGSYLVPGGLVPIEVDDELRGTYTEPNIWLRHSCG